jgi:hypothetical protein
VRGLDGGDLGLFLGNTLGEENPAKVVSRHKLKEEK